LPWNLGTLLPFVDATANDRFCLKRTTWWLS
jgi:hypothetical protein